LKPLDRLKSVEIFSHLGQEDLKSIVGLLQERQLPRDAVLFRHGTAGDALYVVESGSLKGVAPDAAGLERLLAVYSEGDSIGDMALLVGEPWPMTLRTVTECRLLVLGKREFDSFLSSNLQVMLDMMKTIADKQAAKAVVASQPSATLAASAGATPELRTQPGYGAPQPVIPQQRVVPATPVAPPQTPQPAAGMPAYQEQMPAPPPYQPVEAPVSPRLPLYAPAPTGRVFTLFSPKGGVGKSTLAVNLAVALSRLHPGSVALVDLSLIFGHALLMLNMTTKTCLATTNAAALRKMEMENGLSYYMVEHPSSGLRVMAGARRPEEGEVVTGETAKAAIEQLSRHFPLVVVDTGSNFSDPVLSALECADKVLMVCSPEISVLRDLRDCQRIFSEVVHLPKDRVLHIMNYLFPFKGLSKEQFEGTLGQEIFAEIPHGGDVPMRCSLKGEAFVETQRGSAVARAVERLAERLVGEEETAPHGHDDKKKGFLRR